MRRAEGSIPVVAVASIITLTPFILVSSVVPQLETLDAMNFANCAVRR